MKQSTQWSTLSLLRTRLRLFGTEELLISLTSFFQEGNVSKMQLCFKSSFWVNIAVRDKCFCSGFSSTYFQGTGVFSGIFIQNLEVAERARTSLIIYYETLQYAVIYYKPGKQPKSS